MAHQDGWARRWVVTAGTLPALILALLVSGCGGSSGPTIVLYSAQHEQTTDAMIAAFTKQTGIHVRVEQNDEDVLTAQLEEEGELTPADVFYTENSNWLEQLSDQHMLAKVEPATLAVVPKQDSATNGNWVGVSARISVLIYNTSKLKPAELPKSVLELAKPRWRGKIEIAPGETDMWPVISSIVRSYGRKVALRWLIGLELNAEGNDQIPDNETITADVSRGTIDMGLINHYYYYRLISEIGRKAVKASIAYFAPHDPGYVEDISGAAILKTSKHMAADQEFLKFLTSRAGQEVLAHSNSFEYPIRPGVAANSELTPLSQLQPIDFTPAELGTGLNAKELLEESGLL